MKDRDWDTSDCRDIAKQGKLHPARPSGESNIAPYVGAVGWSYSRVTRLKEATTEQNAESMRENIDIEWSNLVPHEPEPSSTTRSWFSPNSSKVNNFTRNRRAARLRMSRPQVIEKQGGLEDTFHHSLIRTEPMFYQKMEKGDLEKDQGAHQDKIFRRRGE